MLAVLDPIQPLRVIPQNFARQIRGQILTFVESVHFFRSRTRGRLTPMLLFFRERLG
jgi:hypothetical protein